MPTTDHQRLYTERHVAWVLSEATNTLCSCGGAGPDDPKACDACRLYHLLRKMLGMRAAGW